MISRRCGNFAETEFRFIGSLPFSRVRQHRRFIHYPFFPHTHTHTRAQSHPFTDPRLQSSPIPARTVKKKEQYTLYVYKEKLLTFLRGFLFFLSGLFFNDNPVRHANPDAAESSPFDPGRPLSATRRDKPTLPPQRKLLRQTPTHTHTRPIKCRRVSRPASVRRARSCLRFSRKTSAQRTVQRPKRKRRGLCAVTSLSPRGSAPTTTTTCSGRKFDCSRTKIEKLNSINFIGNAIHLYYRYYPTNKGTCTVIKYGRFKIGVPFLSKIKNSTFDLS